MCLNALLSLNRIHYRPWNIVLTIRLVGEFCSPVILHCSSSLLLDSMSAFVLGIVTLPDSLWLEIDWSIVFIAQSTGSSRLFSSSRFIVKIVLAVAPGW